MGSVKHAMPIYEYECTDCGEQFEKLVRMSTKESEVECPDCGAHHSKRMVSLMASLGRGGAAVGAASGAACAPSGGG
jgi:putative FmdB family regulatory protein